MSALVPHAVEHAVRQRTVYGASQSFGAVAVALLILVLIEWEMVRMVGRRAGHWALLTVVSVPLVVVVGLLVTARIAPLVP